MITLLAIKALLIAIAAVAKAAADMMRNRFDVSIWRRKSLTYDPRVSYKYAKMIFNYPVDGWHVANSIMIVAFVAAAVVPMRTTWLMAAVLWVAFGAWFIVVFNVFYNRIFTYTKYQK